MAGVILDEKREEKNSWGDFFFVGPFSTFLLIYIPIVRQVPGIKELFLCTGEWSSDVIILYKVELTGRQIFVIHL